MTAAAPEPEAGPVIDAAPSPDLIPLPDDFPVEWVEPRDPELTWYWDDMHMPQALTPLACDYVRMMGMGFGYGYERLALPIEVKVRIWNGFAYFTADIPLPEDEHAAIWERRKEASRAEIGGTHAYWFDHALPEIKGIYEAVTATPVETLRLDELAVAWEWAWQRLGRCWSVHFYVIRGPYQVLEDLADLYEAVVADAAPGDALALIGGEVDELQAVEVELEALLGLVRSSATLVAALSKPEPLVASLPHDADGRAFREAFDAFLAEHGHLGQSWDDLALPSWIEEPDRLLGELGKRLTHPHREHPEARRALMAMRADMLARGARDRLADDPTRLARFEELLAAAKQIGPITETHNYWIDRMVQSRLRRFVWRVGARLVDAGVLASTEDVLYLGQAEVAAALREPEDRRRTVAERRAEHQRRLGTRPPPKVGKPSDDGDGDRFDGSTIKAQSADEVRGTGASGGIARGPARIVVDQSAFGNVQPGDIIVCPSSNPSWVPLFAIAGGLVADTGGVLSHAAVVAREFGLPAVVGTREGTAKIADGRLVELDGSSGVVRLL
jgi:pyruvate,water dikinase